MENMLEGFFNVDLMCRCCLNEGTDGLSMYNVQPDQYNSISYAEMLNECCSFSVQQDDGLPSHICVQCIEQLKISHAFIKMCLRANDTLIGAKREKGKMFLELKPFLKSECVDFDFDLTDREMWQNNEVFNTNQDIKEIDFMQPKLEFDLHGVPAKDGTFIENVKKKKEKRTPVKKKPGHVTSYNSNKTCEICNRKFKSVKLLEEHEDYKHRGIRYYCKQCKKFYTSATRHIRMNHGNGRTCRQCGYKCETKIEFQAHTQKEHKEPQQCDICQQVYSCASHLWKHKQNVHSDQNFFCDYCAKLFSSKEKIATHIMKVHTKTNYYRCTACKVSFESRSSLNTHKLSNHPDEPLYPVRSRWRCELCGKCNKSEGLLKEHVNWVHKGIKYYCELCKKHYTSGIRHNKSNHGKPKQCNICKLTFKNGMEYHVHTNAVHYKQLAANCNKCNVAFPNQKALRIHKYHVHPATLICQYCSKVFKKQWHLDTHLNTHTKEKTYSCHLCEKKFTSRSSMRMHTLRHTSERNYKCEYCDSMFRTKEDLRAHAKTHDPAALRHECAVCGKRFHRSDHRNTHQRNVHKLENMQAEAAALCCSFRDIHKDSREIVWNAFECLTGIELLVDEVRKGK